MYLFYLLLYFFKFTFKVRNNNFGNNLKLSHICIVYSSL